MNQPKGTTEYMMFFRGSHWDEGVSPEEAQRRMNKVMAWFDGLKQEGKVRNGQPLGPERLTISHSKRSGLHDGPFVESKEAVAGYLVVAAESIEEAAAMARTNPSLDYGISIEVRPILEECPAYVRVRNGAPSQAAG